MADLLFTRTHLEKLNDIEKIDGQISFIFDEDKQTVAIAADKDSNGEIKRYSLFNGGDGVTGDYLSIINPKGKDSFTIEMNDTVRDRPWNKIFQLNVKNRDETEYGPYGISRYEYEYDIITLYTNTKTTSIMGDNNHIFSGNNSEEDLNYLKNQYTVFAFGSRNDLIGTIHDDVIFGDSNTVNYATYCNIFGYSNKICGTYNFIIGTGNQSSSGDEHNVVAGDYNTLNQCEYTTVIGKNNIVGRTFNAKEVFANNFIVGKNIISEGDYGWYLTEDASYCSNRIILGHDIRAGGNGSIYLGEYITVAECDNGADHRYTDDGSNTVIGQHVLIQGQNNVFMGRNNWMSKAGPNGTSSLNKNGLWPVYANNSVIIGQDNSIGQYTVETEELPDDRANFWSRETSKVNKVYVFGHNNNTTADSTFLFGHNLLTSNINAYTSGQVILGYYNAVVNRVGNSSWDNGDKKNGVPVVLCVGTGTEKTRKNGLTLDMDGNLRISGNIYCEKEIWGENGQIKLRDTYTALKASILHDKHFGVSVAADDQEEKIILQAEIGASISDDGYWIIDGEKTNHSVSGKDGKSPTISCKRDEEQKLAMISIDNKTGSIISVPVYDGKVEINADCVVLYATFIANSWSYSSGFWQQTVDIANITEQHMPIVDIHMDTTKNIDILQQEYSAYQKLTALETLEGKIIGKCLLDKPEYNFTIKLRISGDGNVSPESVINELNNQLEETLNGNY